MIRAYQARWLFLFLFGCGCYGGAIPAASASAAPAENSYDDDDLFWQMLQEMLKPEEPIKKSVEKTTGSAGITVASVTQNILETIFPTMARREIPADHAAEESADDSSAARGGAGHDEAAATKVLPPPPVTDFLFGQEQVGMYDFMIIPFTYDPDIKQHVLLMGVCTRGLELNACIYDQSNQSYDLQRQLAILMDIASRYKEALGAKIDIIPEYSGDFQKTRDACELEIIRYFWKKFGRIFEKSHLEIFKNIMPQRSLFKTHVLERDGDVPLCVVFLPFSRVGIAVCKDRMPFSSTLYPQRDTCREALMRAYYDYLGGSAYALKGSDDPTPFEDCMWATVAACRSAPIILHHHREYTVNPLVREVLIKIFP